MAKYFPTAARDAVDSLKDLEKQIAHNERMRKVRMADLDYATPQEIKMLQEETLNREAILAAFRSLEAALKNSQASFERFSKQVDKDLARLAKFTPNEPLSSKHPFIRKKLAALKKAAESLEYLSIDMTKMADTINWRIEKADRSVVKIMGDLNRVHAEFDKHEFEELGKYVNGMRDQLSTLFR